MKGKMSVFNNKEDMGKKTKNKSKGSLGPWLNCGFEEDMWRDVWEAFGSDDLFDVNALR